MCEQTLYDTFEPNTVLIPLNTKTRPRGEIEPSHLILSDQDGVAQQNHNKANLEIFISKHITKLIETVNGVIKWAFLVLQRRNACRRKLLEKRRGEWGTTTQQQQEERGKDKESPDFPFPLSPPPISEANS